MTHFPLFCLLALACMVPVLPLPAKAAVIVRSVADLEKDKKVKALLQPFTTASAATVIYERCGKDYQIKPEQYAFQRGEFETAAKNYRDAFHDAYVTRVQAEPEQAMVDSYMQRITLQQQSVVNSTSKLIDQKKCDHKSVHKMFEYYAKLQYAKQMEEYKKATGAARGSVTAAPTTAPTTPQATTIPGSL